MFTVLLTLGMAGTDFVSAAGAAEPQAAQDGAEKPEGVRVKVGLAQGGVELVEPTFVVRFGEPATLTTERDGRRLTLKVTVSPDKDSADIFVTRVRVSEDDRKLLEGVVVSRSGQVASIQTGERPEKLQLDVVVSG